MAPSRPLALSPPRPLASRLSLTNALPLYTLWTCIPAYLHIRIPAYLHAAYLHTCIPAYLHTCIPTYLHTCLPAYLRVYVCYIIQLLRDSENYSFRMDEREALRAALAVVALQLRTGRADLDNVAPAFSPLASSPADCTTNRQKTLHETVAVGNRAERCYPLNLGIAC